MLDDHSKPVGSAALDKGLVLFSRVVRDQGETPLAALASELGLPLSSARRLLAAFERQGLVARVRHGYYAAGTGLAALAHFAEPRSTLVRVVRPIMRGLAKRYGATAHLGILEGDMVTYLAKEQGGRDAIFTRETHQLEAYCSGIGKILLASLDEQSRDEYLSGGDFIALTDRTIVAPQELRSELEAVHLGGYAIDNCEVADNVYCVAVPVVASEGRVIAALSISGQPGPLRALPLEPLLDDLRAHAAQIAEASNQDDGPLRI